MLEFMAYADLIQARKSSCVHGNNDGNRPLNISMDAFIHVNDQV